MKIYCNATLKCFKMNNFLNDTKKTITYGRFMHPQKFHYFTTKICLKLKVFFSIPKLFSFRFTCSL